MESNARSTENNNNVVCSLVCWNQNILPMKFLDALPQMSKGRFRFRRQEICVLRINLICLSTILKILSFHSFIALHSTLSRLHHRLPKSFKADAISSLHLLKSIWEGNLYFGPFETIFIYIFIFRFFVIT